MSSKAEEDNARRKFKLCAEWRFKLEKWMTTKREKRAYQKQKHLLKRSWAEGRTGPPRLMGIMLVNRVLVFGGGGSVRKEGLNLHSTRRAGK